MRGTGRKGFVTFNVLGVILMILKINIHCAANAKLLEVFMSLYSCSSHFGAKLQKLKHFMFKALDDKFIHSRFFYK